MKTWLETTLEALQHDNRLRTLTPLNPMSATESKSGGRHLRLFSSNDYLGLSSHPKVIEAVTTAVQTGGMGSRGASLICGYSSAHEALEFRLASLKKTEAALLMPSGYQANIGLLSALGCRDSTIFSDQLNHASIIDGCRLSRAQVQVFRHGDLNDLEQRLRACQSRKKIVVTDEVFSMDGDRAPLVQIAELKDRYPFIWVTDSAHSTGIYGENGAGLAEAAGVAHRIDFQVGTLSKALGAQGGFVACDSQSRRWLLNSARSFIFSTALPTPIVAAASAAHDVMTTDPAIHTHLWDRVTQLAKYLRVAPQGPIFPLIIGSESDALFASAYLNEAGFHVPAIRPPTVAEGTCRLRITVSAAHRKGDVSEFFEAMAEMMARIKRSTLDPNRP
jgi:8-amino-7-oxononanoate synthase